MENVAIDSTGVIIFLVMTAILIIVGYLQDSDWAKYWKRGLVECEAFIVSKLPAQSSRSVYGNTGGHQEVGSAKQYVGYFFIVEFLDKEGKLIRRKTTHAYKDKETGQKVTIRYNPNKLDQIYLMH